VPDPAVLPADGGARGADARGRDDDLASLRRLLVEPEQRQLAALRARLDDPATRAAEVGAVLPQALLRHALDADLARALAPPVERAITTSVQRNPRPLADALFPVMGPAIRKAVTASLATMIDSLNRTLEHSLSWRSVKWRLEALRTGKSFGEVVLVHTLLYRVEQIFLIERESGLLLQHVASGTAGVQDADMVSGMLTAIRAFVQDSFRVASTESLDELRVGELSVWIEQGPHAVLAAVIRGTAPEELRTALQATLETVHLQCADAFARFSGDADAFEASRPVLEACLRAQYRADSRPRSRRGAWMVFAVIVAALAVWAGLSLRERARWARYLQALRAEPGLVVVSAAPGGGGYLVSGLRDRLARDPDTIRQQAGFEAGAVAATWEPYQALHPRFVLARATEALQPPPGVVLSLRDGVLSVRGPAPVEWLAEARRLAPLVAGVERLDATAVLEDELTRTIAAIEAVTLLFDKGTTRVVAGQDGALAGLVALVGRLDRIAATTGRRLRVEVVGHADADGAPEANLPLSRARAERVLASLAARPPSQVALVATGVGSRAPATTGGTEAEKRRNRRVVLRVVNPGDGE